MATTLPGPAASLKPNRKLAKPFIWALLGLAGISVLLYTEYPLFAHANPDRVRLLAQHVLLFPHAAAGIVATALGPFLFSTRFRARHLKRHRIMGRVYVLCIVVAAPIAYFLGLPHSPLVDAANAILTGLWIACTLAAFLTARNRQIQAHRQWMIRSYLFTLNFIFDRVFNPIPAYLNMSDQAFALHLLILPLSYLFLSQIYFNWHELTTRKA